MKVLLSIKPEFVEKIFSGEKRFEYRKCLFKNHNVDSIVIYSTMPIGRIVGEFKIKAIHKNDPKEIWRRTKKYSGISENFFFNYFKHKTEACAIEILEVKKYKKPINPKKNFPDFVPPQSFCYIKSSYRFD